MIEVVLLSTSLMIGYVWEEIDISFYGRSIVQVRFSDGCGFITVKGEYKVEVEEAGIAKG